ncbi:hypothetical protein, partial [Thiorhodococcus minor]|uniref:hypothetical protein n=1 Tax=Thiorhodococcus minor TaxID=57489 RepID=UPI001ADD039C
AKRPPMPTHTMRSRLDAPALGRLHPSESGSEAKGAQFASGSIPFREADCFEDRHCFDDLLRMCLEMTNSGHGYEDG